MRRSPRVMTRDDSEILIILPDQDLEKLVPCPDKLRTKVDLVDLDAVLVEVDSIFVSDHISSTV